MEDGVGNGSVGSGKSWVRGREGGVGWWSGVGGRVSYHAVLGDAWRKREKRAAEIAGRACVGVGGRGGEGARESERRRDSETERERERKKEREREKRVCRRLWVEEKVMIHLLSIR